MIDRRPAGCARANRPAATREEKPPPFFVLGFLLAPAVTYAFCNCQRTASSQANNMQGSMLSRLAHLALYDLQSSSLANSWLDCLGRKSIGWQR